MPGPFFMQVPMDSTPDPNDLDDTQLMAREVAERDDFKRLQASEPRFGDTTYGVI